MTGDARHAGAPIIAVVLAAASMSAGMGGIFDGSGFRDDRPVRSRTGNATHIISDKPVSKRRARRLRGKGSSNDG
jgi:hypothetical protein